MTPPDARSVAAAARRGLTVDGAARQVTRADFERFDLLVAMDASNASGLLSLAPDEQAAAKVRLLREFDPASAGSGDLDVPDPYYGEGDGFDRVLDLVDAACRGLLEDVRASCRRWLTRSPRRSASRSRELRRVSGGDLNDAYAARARGRPPRLREDGRRRGAGSLRGRGRGAALARRGRALPVPAVLAVADDPRGPRFLALEWIESGAPGPATGEQLGRGLAALHRAGAPGFGGERELVLGSITLPNDARRQLGRVLRDAAARAAGPPGARSRRAAGRSRGGAGPRGRADRRARRAGRAARRACTATSGAATS